MKREEITYQTNTGEFVAEKLLPCPFCGGEPEFVTIGNDYTKSRKAEIKCTKCFCKRTTGAIHNNLEWCGRKAIELWNKRTADLSLPPANGAEEIRQLLLGWEHYKRDHFRESEALDVEAILMSEYSQIAAQHLHVVPRSVAIDAMTEFAALHAQRLAEKMVEERLRGELIKYDQYYWGQRGNSESEVDEYLKTREK